MATPNISVQLYSVREQAKADYEGTIRAIADMGFRYVEPAGFPGSSPEAAAKLFQELGLQAPSCHSVLPLGDDEQEVIETAQIMGHKYIITGCPTNFQKDFVSRDTILATAERYCQAAEVAAKHGLQVGYHNHDWDLQEIDGVPGYRLFLDNTPDTVLWEADLFWVCRAGRDPVEFVKEIGVRGKCLHFKDGLTNTDDTFREVETEDGKIMVGDGAPFLPAGCGQVPLTDCRAVAEHVELSVVELDAYEGDMMQAVAESYRYFKANGIGE